MFTCLKPQVRVQILLQTYNIDKASIPPFTNVWPSFKTVWAYHPSYIFFSIQMCDQRSWSNGNALNYKCRFHMFNPLPDHIIWIRLLKLRSHVSVLYTGHVKEPESYFKKEKERIGIGFSESASQSLWGVIK